jgi:P4 family phage/plasmid primase-like protien
MTAQLAHFLLDHKTERGSTHTHTSISGGSYYIPPNATAQFMSLYKDAAKMGADLHLTEKHMDMGPIVIDLDFRFEPTENDHDVETGILIRRYTAETVTNIFRIYSDIISTYIDDVSHFDMYIMEKPSPVLAKTLIKDGVHMVIPGIVTSPVFQHTVRDKVLPLLKKELLPLALHNKISDVVDEAVIEKNNWQMLCSRKPNCERYRVTRIIRYYTDDGQFDELPVNPDDTEYIELLSIRNKYIPTPIKADKIEELKKYEEKAQALRLRTHLKSTIMGRSKNLRTNQINDDDYKQANDLVNLLSKERAETYSDWIRVGWCLRNIDHRLLDKWVEFSRSSSKFRDGVCERYWHYMRQDGACLGMGTLHLWSKHDNPTEYARIVDEELRNLIRESYNGSEYDVARVIQRKYGHSFAYDSGNKLWFHFYDHRWHLTHDGLALKSKLPTEIATEYRKATSYYINIANSTEDVAQRNTLDELVSKLQGIVHKLKKAAFQSNVMTECAMLFNIDKFDEKLDSNRHLIGFENGIYDLDTMEFRDGRPEDYVSISAKINYMPTEEQPQEVVKDINNYLTQVLPIPGVRDYVLRLFSTFLHGDIREERFNVWTGSGSNSKSLCVSLFQKAFGEYCCTLPIALLTQKRGTSNSASPELARARAKRFAVLQEPGEYERLNIGLMKELTGGDKLYARALYREGCEFKPQFKMILTCNHLPVVPSDDGGTWRRIRVVKFESRFCENPDPNKPNEFPIDTSLSSRLDDWAEVFMGMLIDYYKRNIGKKYKEPEEVLACTREYQRRNDYIADFIDSRLLKDAKGVLLVDEAYADFKQWIKDDGIASDRTSSLSKPDFMGYMEKQFGKITTINRQKGWKGFTLLSSQMVEEEDAYGD